ncbi:hypothetical protein JZM24_14810 [Candidatus Sodalis endolongispinus]|uniref:Uncharacterized protein n=1 Tax=Candidatus Sodalis endolongispinus TaxID=2812662 RepID=A0ABS5YDC4_9GAMM|nr:hypothetical protein [Candidatus Sodalis endolongispinus]MBT9432948.1 hypothetical protein [Candidatus Sodalis endolongispinus]MBT9433076.1 hypothetical protein [Candidatus Sodalis endolongispinus]
MMLRNEEINRDWRREYIVAAVHVKGFTLRQLSLDGGGDWVFNKNGHFYSPQALHAAGATYQEDGNIHGSLWGGHLSGWLNNTFVRDIRLGHMQEVQVWKGPGIRDEASYVITGVYNGNVDAYVDYVQRRILQKTLTVIG